MFYLTAPKECLVTWEGGRETDCLELWMFIGQDVKVSWALSIVGPAHLFIFTTSSNNYIFVAQLAMQF